MISDTTGGAALAKIHGYLGFKVICEISGTHPLPVIDCRPAEIRVRNAIWGIIVLENTTTPMMELFKNHFTQAKQ